MSNSQAQSAEISDHELGGSAPDVENAEAMGQDVLATVHTLREMVAARAQALEGFRAALVEQHARLEEEREAFAQQQNELCDHYETRETELGERETRCLTHEKEAVQSREAQEGEVEQLRADLEARLDALTTRQSDIDEREQKVEERGSEQAAERQAIDAQLKELEGDRAKLEPLKTELAEAEAAAARDRGELEEMQARHLSEREAFESERERIIQERSELQARHDDLLARAEEIEAREQDLEKEAEVVKQSVQHADQQRSELTLLQQQWKSKVDDFGTASSSLSALKQQLESEIGMIAGGKDDVLADYASGDADFFAGLPTGDTPTPAQQAANGAVDRFQKLCRDARRRAIGIG